MARNKTPGVPEREPAGDLDPAEVARVVNSLKTQLAVEKSTVTSLGNAVSHSVIDALKGSEVIKNAVREAVDGITDAIVDHLAGSNVIVTALTGAIEETKADKLAAVTQVYGALDALLGNQQAHPDHPPYRQVPVPLPQPRSDDDEERGAGEGESLDEPLPGDEPAVIRRMMRAMTGR